MIDLATRAAAIGVQSLARWPLEPCAEGRSARETAWSGGNFRGSAGLAIAGGGSEDVGGGGVVRLGCGGDHAQELTIMPENGG